MEGSQPKPEELALARAQVHELTEELAAERKERGEELAALNNQVGQMQATVDAERTRCAELEEERADLSERLETIRKTPSVNVVVPDGILGECLPWAKLII